MYIPNAHEETRLEVLHDLMMTHPLGCIVTSDRTGLVANHVPFLLDAGNGELGTLKCHVARANPLWQELSSEALIIFQGPQAYVSPTWYPSKHQTGKAVPTWNYAAVHAYGTPKVIHDPAWLLSLITELSNIHEASQALPWKVSDAPKDFIENLCKAIVGIEIPISRLEGKWKMSQNRPEADKLGVAAGLQAQPHEAAHAVSDLVKQAMTTQR